jgi:hypothetical protein
LRVLACLLLVACTSSPSPDNIVGPFTGPTRRFVVDRITLPDSGSAANAVAHDLDGNDRGDNQAGMVFGYLAQFGDLTKHGADMIASAAISSTVLVQADDLTEDDSVGVTYLGEDGAPVTVMGGSVSAGTFTANHTAHTRVPGAAELVLPIFADADPSHVSLVGAECTLVADGSGGFDMSFAGGLVDASVRAAEVAGVHQMMTNHPAAHILFARLIDVDHNGVITTDEIASNTLLDSLITPDVKVFDGKNQVEALSLAFQLHLSPCDSGRCAPAIGDACHDRVLDGNETDVDCGGGCERCAPALHCAAPSDCQSGACDAGSCGPPSCTNGLRDGFESDVDCGAPGCARCALGQTCYGGDCDTGLKCDNSLVSSGHCVPDP